MAITISGDVATTLSNLGINDAALLDVGTAANNLIQLDSSGRLPNLSTANVTGISSGGLVQVKYATAENGFTFTNTSGVIDTSLNVTITPTSTSSVILLMFQDGMQVQQGGSTFYNRMLRSINGGADSVVGNGNSRMEAGGSGAFWAFSLYHVDSPNTTSPVTYKREYWAQSGLTGQISMNNARRSLIALEFKV